MSRELCDSCRGRGWAWKAGSAVELKVICVTCKGLGTVPYGHYGGTPPSEAVDTSQEAAESVPAGRLQEVVYRAIESAGRGGLTDEEIELATGLRHQTASARRRELYLKGLIERAGRRENDSGRTAWAHRVAN